jgi:hypothetical protein
LGLFLFNKRWIHYLAFDLGMGRYITFDAQSSGIPHLFVIPCLVLTFLFGPIGFFLYSILKFVRSPAKIE